jgi:hypothetical protein
VWIAVLAAGLVGLLLACCGGGEGRESTEGGARSASAAAAAGFVALPTWKCPSVGEGVSPVAINSTTWVAIPHPIAAGLAAYRDAAGTTLVGPRGWKCEAGIGEDDSERINVFPPGHPDPGEPPFHPGEVVSLQLYTTCERCIAEYVCPLFPTARVVKKYGTTGGPQCPAEGLPERSTHVSAQTALFFDPPNSEATGTGSGGRAPTLGAMSYTEATGMRKVSCTLAADLADVCAGIVGAAMLAAPL